MQTSELSESRPRFDSQDPLVLLLSDVSALIERRWAMALSPYGLSIAEFRVLLELSDNGPETATHIARAVPIDPSFVSRTVQRLTEKGLVSRRRSRTDRRSVTLQATTQGKDLASELSSTLRVAESELLKGISTAELSDTRSVLLEILDRLEQAMEA